MRDVMAAYDALARIRGCDRAGNIGVVGSSYGAYLGALLVYMRPLRFLALRAGALHGPRLGAAEAQASCHPDFAAYRRLALRAEDNRALGACAQFLGDALVVESEHDEGHSAPGGGELHFRARQCAFADLPRDRGRGPFALASAMGKRVRSASGQLDDRDHEGARMRPLLLPS